MPRSSTSCSADIPWFSTSRPRQAGMPASRDASGILQRSLCAVPHREQSRGNDSFQLEPTVPIRARPTEHSARVAAPVYQLAREPREECRMALIRKNVGNTGEIAAHRILGLDQLRAGFAKPSLRCAIWQLTNTLPAFLFLWLLMAWSLRAGWSYGWTLLLVPPTAGLYVRLFIIQHDCGHGSF